MRKIVSTFIFYPKVESSQFCPVSVSVLYVTHLVAGKTQAEDSDEQIKYKGKAAA